MTMDPGGSVCGVAGAVNPFRRLTPKGEKPTVIECGGSPCAVGKDGNVYFPRDNGLTIVRCSPRGGGLAAGS